LGHLSVIAFWLLAWEIAAAVVGRNIILVSPRVTFARLFSLALEAAFWNSIALSLGRILQGFVLALIVGVVLAAASARWTVSYRLFLPAINVMNAIPIASFTILALMAVRVANLSVFISFVTVLPIIFFNTYKGIESTDGKLLQMSQVFNVRPWKIIIYIYMKTVAPFVVSAASAGIGFAWKSGIAAELIGVVQGTIGFHLNTARIFLQTADVLAWTIAIVLLSYLMEKSFLFIFNRRTWKNFNIKTIHRMRVK